MDLPSARMARSGTMKYLKVRSAYIARPVRLAKQVIGKCRAVAAMASVAVVILFTLAEPVGAAPIARWEARSGDLRVSFWVERRPLGRVITEYSFACVEDPDWPLEATGWTRSRFQPLDGQDRLHPAITVNRRVIYSRQELWDEFRGRLDGDSARLSVDLSGDIGGKCGSRTRHRRVLTFRRTKARHIRTGLWRITGPRPLASGFFYVYGGGAVIRFDGYSITGAPFQPPTSPWESPCLAIAHGGDGLPFAESGQYLEARRERHLLNDSAIDESVKMYLRFTSGRTASALYTVGDLVPNPPNTPVPTSCIPVGGGLDAEFQQAPLVGTAEGILGRQERGAIINFRFRRAPA
jgi:hypothetical protein